MAIDPDKAIEKMYYFEKERQRLLYSQLSVPSGILVVLGGLFAYFIQNFEWSLDASTSFFGLLTFLGGVLFLVALAFTFHSLIQYKGREIKTASTWKDHAENNTGEAFSTSMRSDLAEAATTLREANDRRQNSLYYAYVTIVLDVIMAVIASIFFFVKTLC